MSDCLCSFSQEPSALPGVQLIKMPACYFCPKDGGRKKDAFFANFSLCPRRDVNYPIYYEFLLLSCYSCVQNIVQWLAFPKLSDKNLDRLKKSVSLTFF